MNDDASEFARIIEEAEKASTGLNSIGKAVDPLALLPGVVSDDDEDRPNPGAASQYALHGPGYRPTTPTVPKLPSGCYDIQTDQHGPFCVPTLPPAGLLLELPEMRSEHVLELVDRFWNSEIDYKEGNDFVHGGAAYRCGIMLYGPPGTGKSCTIKLVSRKLVARGGTVFFADEHPGAVNIFLSDFRRIEPDRKCVVILEDFDSLIHRFGEDAYLQMLDSAKSIDNVMFIATTNYPERLDPRVYNRPGRFSHVIKIGLPGIEGRRAFLNALLKNKRDVDKIVSITNDFSIDHLSALVNAVYREKKDLETEVDRLRKLFRMPKSDSAIAPIGVGGGT